MKLQQNIALTLAKSKSGAHLGIEPGSPITGMNPQLTELSGFGLKVETQLYVDQTTP